MVHNGLTPEKRININGVAVTKHILRPGRVGPKLAFPDMLKDNPALFSLKVKLNRAISESEMDDAERRAFRRTLHPTTMPRLGNNGGKSMEVFQRAIRSCVMTKSFTLLNNMGALLHMCDDEHYGDFNYYVAGLNGHAERGPDMMSDYSEATEEELAVPRALLRTTFEMEDDPDYTYVTTFHHAAVPNTRIISLPLTELIERRPQDVERIIALLRERSLMVDFPEDIVHLEALLDSGVTSPLWEGVL